MAIQQTVWWDKNGAQHTGYIKDGKTFTDENATARVPVGATVQTQGGTFKMTDTGGVPTLATARNQFQQGTDAAINAYRAAGQIQQERINAATDAAISQLNRQKQIAGQSREDADRAAREAYRAAANPFGAQEEQRVRLGLDNSGYAESSKLRLASDYAAQLTANQRAMNDQLRDIDVQIAQARASGKYELANMLEARAQNIMQQKIALEGNLYSADMQAIGQAENMRQYNESMALQREQMALQEKQAAEQNKYNLALAFLENGMDTDFVSSTLGIPKADVAAYANMVKAQRAAPTVRSSGGEEEDSTVTQKDKARLAYLQSLVPQIQQFGDFSVWLSKYGSAYKLDKNDIQMLGTLMTTGDTVGNSNNNYGSKYEAAKVEVREMKMRGYSQEEIENFLDRYSTSELTDEGIVKLLGLG